MKKFKIIFLSLIITSNAFSSELPSFDLFEISRNTMQNCDEVNKCLTLDEAIDLSKKNNFETRIDAIRVYQARQFVKVRVGQLLPSFNLRLSFPIDWFEYIPGLIGFIFPSNWFRLKESKLHAKASEQSYYGLMANQINSTESLFYNIHKEMINFEIYNNHWKFVSNLKKIMAMREQNGEIAPEEVEKAKIYLSDINITKIALNNSFGELYPQMGYAINLPSNWDKFQLKRIPMPNLTDVEEIDFETFYENVIEKSYELKTLTLLQQAAKYSKRSRAFEFLTPDSSTDSAFGFGYLSNINIGKADEAIVKVKAEMVHANLREALYKVVSNYNTSLQIYQEANNSLNSIKYVIDSLLEDFSVNSKIEIEELKSYLQENIYFQWTKNYSIHGYLLAKAQLERLLLSSVYYQDIEKLLPVKKSKLKCFQRKENRKIKKAIESGELKDTTIKFSKEETKFCL